MQVRRFHKNRKDIHKAGVVCQGKAKLHSIIDGEAIFDVGDDGKDHKVFLFINAGDLYNLMAVRDILRPREQAPSA